MNDKIPNIQKLALVLVMLIVVALPSISFANQISRMLPS